MDWIKKTFDGFKEVYDVRCKDVDYSNSLYHATSAIEYIRNNYPAPYTLMASGGVDSQAMIYSWIKSGCEFRICNIRYINNEAWFNEFDFLNMQKFIQNYNLKISHLDFDIINFLDSEYQIIAEKYKCSSPQICSHIKNISSIKEGTVIYSGNLLGIRASFLNFPILGLQRYKEEGHNLVPFFFLSTPNLAYSTWKYQLSKFNNYTQPLNYYNIKCSIYLDNGYHIEPSTKAFSGFEKVKDYYDARFKNNIPIAAKLASSYNGSRSTFDVLFRHKFIQKFRDPQIKFLWNDTNLILESNVL